MRTHPIYLGTLLFCLAFLFVTFSLVSIGTWIAFFLFFDRIATYEEKSLIKILGEDYTSYQKQVSKWFPKIRWLNFTTKKRGVVGFCGSWNISTIGWIQISPVPLSLTLGQPQHLIFEKRRCGRHEYNARAYHATCQEFWTIGNFATYFLVLDLGSSSLHSRQILLQ